MAVIGIYSVKGGVGKTTLAVDMAWRSAAVSGQRTLLWDLDPQGGAGWLLGLPDRVGNRAASAFLRDGRPTDLIVPTRYPGLDVLQADESMRGLSLTLARIGKRKRLARAASFLSSEYPRIVIDCPPVLNEISDQVFAAVDLLIVPLPPSPLSARALPMIREEILERQPRHPPILPVLSMYDARRKLHREVLSGFAAGWPVIPMASTIEQTAARRAPLATFAAWSEVNTRLQRLWDGIEAKLAMRAALEG
ncbi:chromosome partitioning protein ParA [Novosphingobium fuchskuhlense]|uniref:Chromosome partitioning protein ParA n=2 Tax=Novosphingobium fuchskuhlense TaxID=1117702 RepID=A0A117UYG8_9SPHN|nr:chromosome partitioning protein ParA [Novosphingobium fuchskuhlense]